MYNLLVVVYIIFLLFFPPLDVIDSLVLSLVYGIIQFIDLSNSNYLFNTAILHFILHMKSLTLGFKQGCDTVILKAP